MLYLFSLLNWIVRDIYRYESITYAIVESKIILKQSTQNGEESVLLNPRESGASLLTKDHESKVMPPVR